MYAKYLPAGRFISSDLVAEGAEYRINSGCRVIVKPKFGGWK